MRNKLAKSLFSSLQGFWLGVSYALNQKISESNRVRHAQTKQEERAFHADKCLTQISLKHHLEGTTSQAIGGRRLSWSTEVFQLTPRLHQTHLLWEPSSRETGMAASFRERLRA